jgi:hypothetical protein
MAYITKACCYLHNMAMPEQPFINPTDFRDHLRLLLDEVDGALNGAARSMEEVFVHGSEEAIQPHAEDIRTMVASAAYEAYRERQSARDPDDVDLTAELRRLRELRQSYARTTIGKITTHYVLN